MKSVWKVLPVCVATSCAARNSRDMWEDTKTCGHYMGQGMLSFLGQHKGKRDYPYYRSWVQDGECFAGGQRYEGGEVTLEDYLPLEGPSPGDPGSALHGIDGFRTPDATLAQLFAKVHFAFDSSAIQGEDNLKIMKEITSYLQCHPKTYVFVEGHADERGPASYNLALGSRLANAVRDFLINNGVNPEQLFTISYGKERPLALGHDESAHRENRRAQFKLYDR